jgi:hypothetical protein
MLEKLTFEIAQVKSFDGPGILALAGGALHVKEGFDEQIAAGFARESAKLADASRYDGNRAWQRSCCRHTLPPQEFSARKAAKEAMNTSGFSM